MSTDEEWSLWQGKNTRLMQTWPREVSEHMKGANITLDFITYGNRRTLDAIRDLNNAQIKAQHGETQ